MTSAKQLSTLHVLYGIFRRDIIIAWRKKSDVINVIFFFIIATSLFPLGLGADAKLLHAIAPSVLWVCALLSCMLSLPRMFAADFADGALEKLIMSGQPITLVVLMKILAHWALSGLPLILVAPLIGMQFNLNGQELWVLALSLLLGTPTLSLIGSIGAALTLGLRGGGVLIALLILPLFIPVLVFGAGAVNAVFIGLNPDGGLALLGAILALALLLAPLTAGFAIKIALE